LNIKILVAGMGYWGKNLVRNFDQLGVLYAVCDSNPAVKDVLNNNYPQVKYFSDFAAAIFDTSIQAVALATPAVQHYQMAKTALEYGKDVFVEKPLAVKVNDGEELVKIAENKGRILMVGHILNYHPAVIRLKQLIDNGELGKIRYLYSNRLSMGKIRTEENILWSFAPHDISVMLDLIGELPTSVKCQGSAYLSKEIYDVTLSEFNFPGGIAAHIFVSWLHPFKEQRLVVIGSEKMAVFEDTSTEKLKLYPHKIEWNNQIPTAVQAKAEVLDLPAAEPLKSECMEFLNSIATRKPPKTDGHEGLRTLKVLDLCEKSIVKN